MAEARRCLQEVGIEPERLEMVQLSAAMAARFAEVADEMTRRIARLGPCLPSNGNGDQENGDDHSGTKTL